MIYAGRRSDRRRRVYVRDLRHVPGPALVFAVYARHAGGCFELVARVYDQPYVNELVWEGDRWRRSDRPLSPAERAEQHRLWWVHVAGCPQVEVVALRPARLHHRRALAEVF